MKYKLVDLFICRSADPDYSLQGTAFENAVRLQGSIERAYGEAMQNLRTYRAENGRFPDTLDQIEALTSQQNLAAFQGFKYARRSDESADIVTGLYGTATFGLSRDQ